MTYLIYFICLLSHLLAYYFDNILDRLDHIAKPGCIVHRKCVCSNISRTSYRASFQTTSLPPISQFEFLFSNYWTSTAWALNFAHYSYVELLLVTIIPF